MVSSLESCRPGARRLDRIDVADHVGDRHVGRGQLLDVARVALAASAIGVRSPASARPARRHAPQIGCQRVVVDLAARHHRDRARRAASTSARSRRVLAWPRRPSRMKWCRESSALTSCGMHRVVVADDAGEERARRRAASRSGCRAPLRGRCGGERSPRSTARRSSPSVEIAEGLGIPWILSQPVRRPGAAVAWPPMPFFERGRPRVFAHRGGSALGPENTLAAFDLGLAAGADGLELDVHLSADGVPVVVHDATLDRTTDATGPVAARTAAELARVDAGCRFAGAARRLSVPRAGHRHSHAARRAAAATAACPIIIEMKVDSEEMGAARGRRRPRRRRRGPRCARPATARAAPRRSARALPRAGHQRVPRRGAAGACTARGCGWPVKRPPLWRLSGARARRTRPRSSRRASSGTRTRPASRCRCGRWTTRPTWSGCWRGASTRLISNRPDLAVCARTRS